MIKKQPDEIPDPELRFLDDPDYKNVQRGMADWLKKKRENKSNDEPEQS